MIFSYIIQLVWGFICFNFVALLLFSFNSLNQKKISFLKYNIPFASVRLQSDSIDINKMKYASIKLERLNFNLINRSADIHNLKIFNILFNFNIKHSKGLIIRGDLCNNKVQFNYSLIKNRVKFDCNGITDLIAEGTYYDQKALLKFTNTEGYFNLLKDNLYIRINHADYFLNLKANIKDFKVDKAQFNLKKNSQNKMINLTVGKDVLFESKNKTMHLKLNLNKSLNGFGSLDIYNKFGIFDSNLNFKLDMSKKGLFAHNFGKQRLRISEFGFDSNKVNWVLNIDPMVQSFVLDSKDLKLNAKFIQDYIKFTLGFYSKKVDINAKGTIDYKENIVIDSTGNYISLLDMKPLFGKKSENTIKGKFKWKKAKWIEGLFLEDMEIKVYKSKEGLKSCTIKSHFENNKVKLWKNSLESPLHFKVWNFARAFELMYGDQIFKSTGILNGEIFIQKDGMPWSFMLHEFESINYLTAIYLQLFSLRFWTSMIKRGQKKWDYLYGFGNFTNTKYNIEGFIMENDYFRVDGAGFIHRYEDLLSIDGYLLSKSITSDLKDLLKQKQNKIPFQMNGSIKDPKITHQTSFKKLISPILPFAFFLL